MKESVMIMFIIAASYLFAFTLISIVCNSVISTEYGRIKLKQMGCVHSNKHISFDSRFFFTASCSYSNDFSNIITSYNNLRVCTLIGLQLYLQSIWKLD